VSFVFEGGLLIAKYFRPGWLIGRSLKYATFLAGDGNFHLQQKAGKPDLKSDASLIGDYGFWAPQDIFEQYQNASGVDIQERVCLF